MEYPRVSHVLDVLDWGYGNIPPFVLKRAAKYGTGFHNLVHKKTTGQKSRVTQQYKTRYNVLMEWLNKNQFKVKEAERKILYIDRIDISKGYQGTCDAILINKDHNLILIDYKTGRVTKRHFLQCSAYKMAYEQETLTKIDKIIIVKPTKEGIVEEYDLDKPSSYYEKVFLRLLDKYYSNAKHYAKV